MGISQLGNGDTISIIIPVYNTEAYLDTCVRSVVEQTYRWLQIILVDDGSTDRSGEIADRWGEIDKRITVIHQSNQGLSAARNAGIDIAEGKYIIFLDSDDWMEINSCEVSVKKAVEENADVVLWSYYREYEEAKPVYILGMHEVVWDQHNITELYKMFVGLDGKQLWEPQKADAVVTAWGKLYRREAIGNIRFVDTKIIGTEDALFNIYIFSELKRAVYIPELLSHYRKTNTQSLTHHYKEKLVYQWKTLYELIEQYLRKKNAPDDFYRALENRIALGLIGLGLNLAEDSVLSEREKIKELRKILEMEHYQRALKQFPIKNVPVHWRLFFLFGKKKAAFGMYMMLTVMNILRG